MGKVLGSDRGITVTNQDLNETSTTQKQKLGERLVRDERVFRYVQCKTEALTAGRAAATLANPKESYACGATTVHNIGQRTVTIDAVADLAANELAGGYLCYKSTRFYSHKILSHPAIANTVDGVITLETPIVDYPITEGDNVTCFPSIWKVRGHITVVAGAFKFVGVPLCSVAVGSYAWIQTWGPILMCPGEWYGADNEEKMMVFTDGGALALRTDSGMVQYQDAGFLLPDTWTVGSAPADLADQSHLLMLQLCP